jgi:hypothetical protein
VREKRGASDEKPKRRHLNLAEERALLVADVATFARSYARKAQKRQEPNDRGYSREVEQKLKRMRPEELD